MYSFVDDDDDELKVKLITEEIDQLDHHRVSLNFETDKKLTENFYYVGILAFNGIREGV